MGSKVIHPLFGGAPTRARLMRCWAEAPLRASASSFPDRSLGTFSHPRLYPSFDRWLHGEARVNLDTPARARGAKSIDFAPIQGFYEVPEFDRIVRPSASLVSRPPAARNLVRPVAVLVVEALVSSYPPRPDDFKSYLRHR